MKNAIMPLVLILVLVSSCSGSKSSGKAQEIAQGVMNSQDGFLI